MAKKINARAKKFNIVIKITIAKNVKRCDNICNYYILGYIRRNL